MRAYSTYSSPFGQNLTKSAIVPAQKVYLACLWRLLNNSGPNRQRYILEAQRGKKYSKIGIKLLSVIYFFQFIHYLKAAVILAEL